MKNKTRILFAILSLIVASLACGENINPPVIEKGRVVCDRHNDDVRQVFIADMEYGCSCPSAPVKKDQYLRSEIEGMTNEQLEGVLCGSSTSSNNEASATEPPTEEPAPTEPPTEAPTEPPLASILDGKVSYCSVTNSQYYMNLPFNPGADPVQVQQELDNGDLKVELKGTNTLGKCQVSAVNQMLLCAFPAASFPAFSSTAPNTIINVVHKGTVIDVIPFSNACQAPQTVNSGGDNSSTDGSSSGSGGGEVLACDPHIELDRSICPVDCNDPANGDLNECG